MVLSVLFSSENIPLICDMFIVIRKCVLVTEVNLSLSARQSRMLYIVKLRITAIRINLNVFANLRFFFLFTLI